MAKDRVTTTGDTRATTLGNVRITTEIVPGLGLTVEPSDFTPPGRITPTAHDALLGFSSSGAVDISIVDGDIDMDGSLVTSAIISLLTDARAGDDIELDPAETDRRGWWGDAAGDSLGGLIWLLGREKSTQETATRAAEYARQAMEWLINEGIAERVDVSATFADLSSLLLQISVVRGSATAWARAWDAAEDQDLTIQGLKFQFTWT